MALTCPACGAEFETQEQLYEHTRSTHGSSFRCPACGAEFETQEQLDEHTRSTHPMRSPWGGGRDPSAAFPREFRSSA